MKDILAFLASIVIGMASLCGAQTSPRPTHGDPNQLPGGCASCHSGHEAQVGPLLQSSIEGVCLGCHRKNFKGQGAIKGGIKDIASQIEKTSHHPVMETGKYHHVGEKLGEEGTTVKRHVSCADCHDPHQSVPSKPWAGVSGVSAAGVFVEKASQEYEVCFKCHSIPGHQADQKGEQRDIRQEFSTENASYHAVLGPGRSWNLPSLRLPWTPTSILGCGDCHNRDRDNEAKGPHGSDFPPLLARNYTQEDGLEESPYQYDLCYQCHERSSILANLSFPRHRDHIQGSTSGSPTLSLIQGGGTSCYTCHASHGSKENPSLVRFNLSVVSPDRATGRLEYRAIGKGHGQCYLECHGKNHSPGTY